MGDKINPSHYKSGGVIQVIDVIEIFNLNFSRGNVIKYALRAGKKDEQGYEDIEKEIEDLKKCVWYAQREIERLIKLKDKL